MENTYDSRPRKERFRRHNKEERREEKRKFRLKKRRAARERREEEKRAKTVMVRKKRIQLEPGLVPKTDVNQFGGRGAMMLKLAQRKRKVCSPIKVSPVAAKKAVFEKPAKDREEPTSTKSRTKYVEPTQRPCQKILPRVLREDLALESGIKIGSGSYGQCIKTFYRGNLPVVVKRFRSHVKKEDVLHEAGAILSLQTQEHHPCLPLLLGVSVNCRPFIMVTQFYGDESKSYTLANAVRVPLFQSFSEWLGVFESLSRTLSHVHSKQWLHNDVKQNNVICHYARGKWGIILIDFGKAIRIANAKPSGRARDHTKYPWVAPEVITAKAKPTTASDVYSLGYVFKYVLGHLKESSSQDLKTVISECMNKDPLKRPSIHSVVQSLVRLK